MMTSTCRKISVLLAVFLGMCFVCTPLFALEGFKITATTIVEAGPRVKIYLTAENQLGEAVCIAEASMYVDRLPIVWDGDMVTKDRIPEDVLGRDAFYNLGCLDRTPCSPVGKNWAFGEEWIKYRPFYEPSSGIITIPANSTVVFAMTGSGSSKVGSGKIIPCILEVCFASIRVVEENCKPVSEGGYLLRAPSSYVVLVEKQ